MALREHHHSCQDQDDKFKTRGQENQERRKEGDSWQGKQQPGAGLTTEQSCPDRSPQGCLQAPGPQKPDKLPEAAPGCGTSSSYGTALVFASLLPGVQGCVFRKANNTASTNWESKASWGAEPLPSQGQPKLLCAPLDTGHYNHLV